MGEPIRTALWVDPSLAEAAVWRALTVAGPGSVALASHGRRTEPVYEIASTFERDAAFGRLAQREFEELGLADPLRQAVSERPELVALVRVVLVAEARRPQEEGVTCEQAGMHLGMRVDAARFDDRDRLLEWARHVLGHAQDSLAPDFGFQPGWEEDNAGVVRWAMRERLHRLWDVSVDARLVDEQLLPPGPTCERHRRRLAGDLPNVDQRTIDAVLELLWNGPRPTFAQLLGWAARPSELVRAASPSRSTPPRPDRCPLCGFVSDDIGTPDASLSRQVSTEYPDWRPESGLCGRCADRYRFAGRLGGQT
ncbi:MAG: hypothetical protein WD830_07550 [Chloroflexota bacterium]